MKRCLSNLLVLSLGLNASAVGTPENLPALQREAVSLYSSGRYEAAIPLYRRIARAQPESRGALNDLLIVLWNGEHYKEAAEEGARLEKLSKNDVNAEFIYARALLATGQKEAALRAFQRCRELDPNEQHIRLAEARVEGMLRQYDQALAHLESLQKAHPDYQDVYPELAKVQQLLGQYAPAASNWSRAASAFPDNRAYRFHEAECLYYSGHRDEAMRKLKALSSGSSLYWPAIDFLTDATLAGNDLGGARGLLESHLTTLHPGDEFRLMKLIRIDQALKDWQGVMATADRWLVLDPQSGDARTQKAGALTQLGRNAEALQLYQEVAQMNPAAIGAWTDIAQAEDALARPQKALEAIERARALDPTDPYLLMEQSHYLSELGKPADGEALLKDWMAKNSGPAVPALLYHGLTPNPMDPMLAYAVNRSTSTFSDQMQALHDAGYTTVTTRQVTDWLKGQGTLPEHPILITFDDARLDSFQYADPVLEKYGWKAAMFVPLSNVDGYLPKYATWPDLEHYAGTGRWDLESHGNHAHEHVPTDAEGRVGLYLVNKQWLPGSSRLETDEEWSTRVRDDYASAKRRMAARLGSAPQNFAFPEGNYGQEGTPNAVQAAARNLEWARGAYASAYHEDEHGFIPRGRDPAFLTRYEPPQGQTGIALVHHLTDDSPSTLMTRWLLREAASNGRAREAYAQLSDLRGRGVSQSSLEAEEARIRLSVGDWEGAQALAQKAVSQDDSPENRALLESIQQYKRYFWQGNFTYWEDNEGRVSRRFRQDIGRWTAAGLEWSLHQFTGSYSGSAVPHVMEQGGGFGVARNLNTSNRLSLEVSGHAFTGLADNTYTIGGELQSALTDKWSSDLRGGRDLIYYASALDADVIVHYVDETLSWRPKTDWRAYARGRLEDLSDDNKRATGVLEGGHQVLIPNLWLVARATLDSTERISPNYYSPQLLQEYQLGAAYSMALTSRANLELSYLPGYGKEKTSDGEFVNDIDVTLNWALGHSLTLSPTASFIRQPTYHRNTYGATLIYRF